MATRIIAYISLGGNRGGERAVFAQTLATIEKWPDLCVLTVSSIYKTEPQDDLTQPWFHNQAAALACGLSVTPGSLLAQMLALETELGRVRDASRRYGPRILDLDLLLFGDSISTTEELILPHPRMTQRAFVLIPLLEIAPGLHLPDGTLAAESLAKLSYKQVGRTIYQPAPYHAQAKEVYV